MTKAVALPDGVLIALGRLGNSLRLGAVPPRSLVDGAAAALNTLSVSRIMSVSNTIQNMLGFYHWGYGSPMSEGQERALHQLACMPALAQFFMFHPNGYVREAALRAVVEVTDAPLMLAAITMRLNDWAAPP